MTYYPTLDEDLIRAKQILQTGAPCSYRPDHNGECLDCDESAEGHELVTMTGETIYGADVYAAYKLLESFVAAIEAVGPDIVKTAMRAQSVRDAPPEPPANKRIKRGYG